MGCRPSFIFLRKMMHHFFSEKISVALQKWASVFGVQTFPPNYPIKGCIKPKENNIMLQKLSLLKRVFFYKGEKITRHTLLRVLFISKFLLAGFWSLHMFDIYSLLFFLLAFIWMPLFPESLEIRNRIGIFNIIRASLCVLLIFSFIALIWYIWYPFYSQKRLNFLNYLLTEPFWRNI